MSDYAGNITAAGVRRRRIGGVVGLVVALVLAVVLFRTHAQRALRIVLFAPFAMAALGFFQARERTCVALGAAGRREMEDGGTCPLAAPAQRVVAAHVRKVFVESVVVAAIATAIVWIL